MPIEDYAAPNYSGGVTINTEMMIVDLITVYKAGGVDLERLITEITEAWPQVEIQVAIPKASKS